MSADQDDNTLSGLPPLPTIRPGDDDGFGTGPDAGSAPSAPGDVPGAASAAPPPSGSGTAIQTAAPQREDEGENEVLDGTSGCVVMGPSGSGKTTLLLALDQACSSPAEEDDRFRLELVGGPGAGTSELAAWGIGTIMEAGKRVRPTDLPGEYSASVTATQEETFWRPARQFVSHLVFNDGPGGLLFPGRETTPDEFAKFFAERKGAEFLRAVETAETLVLCVDASEPRAELVSQYMRSVLAEAAKPYTPQPSRPLGHRFLRRLRLAAKPKPLRTERRIRARRFLLLLTKIDQLLARQLDWEDEDADGIEPPRPADLASHLSPVQTACELLDESNLLRILNALQPEAEFAVGLTSAWGFDPYTGSPFMERDEPVALSSEERTQRLLNWRPYGIREALLFITAGEVRQPVELVRRSDLGNRLKRLDLDVDVPPRFFDLGGI